MFRVEEEVGRTQGIKVQLGEGAARCHGLTLPRPPRDKLSFLVSLCVFPDGLSIHPFITHSHRAADWTWGHTSKFHRHCLLGIMGTHRPQQPSLDCGHSAEAQVPRIPTGGVKQRNSTTDSRVPQYFESSLPELPQWTRDAGSQDMRGQAFRGLCCDSSRTPGPQEICRA